MKKLILLGSLCMLMFSLNAQDMEKKIDDLIGKMTLEEKASLCSGRDDWSTQPIERLDIPWIWVADGPHGLRRAPKTNVPGYGDQLPATCFPTASALAATWDLDLIYQVGQALGVECQANDVNVLLGPGVNIKRSVLAGRNFEFFSEDPLLSGELGAAYINGVQSQGVGTSLKHYVANNVETERMYANSNMDKRTLHEIYLTPFEISVKKAQPWTIMACYNRVQGIYGTESPYLLNEVLRDDWGFKGIVISDWFAVVDRVEGIKSGMNIEMPGIFKFNDKLIVEAIKNGDLDEAQLDKLVKEILTIVLKAKSLEKENVRMPIDEHHAFARKVAAEAATLLKNEEDVLPLTSSKYKRVAIIGEFAKNARFQGNGSSEVKPTKLDQVIDILKEEYGDAYEFTYSRGYDLKNDEDYSMIEKAKILAAESDIALVFAGLPLHYESEGIDRTHIDLPPSHNKLIGEVAAVQKNTAVVLTNGSAVAMPWVNEVPTILEGWLGGQAGAGGIVDVLTGQVNPSGKLAETFPLKLEDTPSSFNFPAEQGEVLYGERIYIGYRYYDIKNIKVLFPFGHGLSYTQFDYSNIQLSSKKIQDTDVLKVSVDVKNTGTVDGKEVVQLYVKDIESTLNRPEKELKEFAKLELKAGESKTIEFELNERDFSYFNAKKDRWIAESGTFEICIGASSRDIRQKASFELESTKEVPLAFDEYTFFRAYWDNPQTRELIKAKMPKWISGFVPEGSFIDNAVFHDFLIDHPLIKYPYITGGEVSMGDVMEIVEESKKFKMKP